MANISQLSQMFGAQNLPNYMAWQKPDRLATALHMMTGVPSGSDSESMAARGLATQLKNDVYSKFKTTPISQWVNNYWDWLRGGAPNQQVVASTQQTKDYGNLSNNVLHYVPGQGYVAEADLETADPAYFKQIQDERAAAVKDTGTVNSYYESNPVTTGVAKHTDYTSNKAAAPNMAGQGSLRSAWVAQAPRPHLNPPAPTGIAGGMAGSGSGANRNGNTATTSVPGQTVKTLATAAPSMSGQYRQAAAKRTGRSLSQAGITTVPTVNQQYSRSLLRQTVKGV